MKHIRTLSDLTSCKIIRNNGTAEIVIDHIRPEEFPHMVQDWVKDVRLIGFYTDAGKSDFEIYEEGFLYYQEFLKAIEKQKQDGRRRIKS